MLQNAKPVELTRARALRASSVPVSGLSTDLTGAFCDRPAKGLCGAMSKSRRSDRYSQHFADSRS